jgi:hypothetical protein
MKTNVRLADILARIRFSKSINFYREIISVNMEFQSNVSETVSASITRADVMSDTSARCICTHDWLSEPLVLVRRESLELHTYTADRKRDFISFNRRESFESYLFPKSMNSNCLNANVAFPLSIIYWKVQQLNKSKVVPGD